MEQQNKPKKAKDVGELIHHFIHQVFPTESRSNYWYDESKLYYSSTCIATKIPTNDAKNPYIVLIWSNFDRRGSFGSGYAAWNIRRACGGVYPYVMISDNKLLKGLQVDNITEEEKLNLVLDSFYTDFKEDIINPYAHIKYLSKGNSYVSRYTYGNSFNDFITKFPNTISALFSTNPLISLFNISEDTIKQHVFNKHEWIVVKYRGWGRPEHEYIKVDKPVSFYLDINNWYTPEEKAIIEFKIWKENISNRFRELDWSLSSAVYTLNLNNRRTITTFKDIYNNPEDVSKLKEGLVKRKQEVSSIRAEKQRIAAHKAAIELQEILNNWLLNGSGTWSLWEVPIHLRINGDMVETSKGVSVPIKHAELLYKFFKKTIKNDIPWESNGHTFKIGNYKVEHINKTSSGNWFLKAGCHTIFETEIDKFITMNNLNWDEGKD